MMVVAIFLMVASAASAAMPNQRTDLKVLLLSATGTEPSTSAWEAALKREGVPFVKKVATNDEPYTASTFADTVAGAPRAKYQAVIVATGGLVYEDNGTYPSALSTEEWAALADFEVKYGIRQVTGFVYPSAEYGLNTPTVSGELGGTVGKLTAAGLTTFPYLKGDVPIDQYTWGYQATPATGANFKTLVTGPGGSALVGINTRADGRQEMVSTFDSNQYQLQNQLLRHGMLTWATRGVFLGSERNYLTVHVDDLFLSSDRWDPTTHSEDTIKTIRMTPTDVYRTAFWSAANNFRLDMLFNASGSDAAGTRDPLTQAMLLTKSGFGWINHTYSGEPNYDTSVEHIVNDIRKNISWARARGIPIDSTDLVFDQHSGQSNPNTPAALAATGVKWLGDDNSRFPLQRQIGPALTVPRYPELVHDDLLHEAGDLGRVPRQGGLADPAARARQRSASALRASGQPGQGRNHPPGHGRGPEALPLLLQAGDRSADAEGSGPDHPDAEPVGVGLLADRRLPAERQDRGEVQRIIHTAGPRLRSKLRCGQRIRWLDVRLDVARPGCDQAVHCKAASVAAE
jgi:hypothetical protein